MRKKPFNQRNKLKNDAYEGASVLVTGAEGFLGTHLTRSIEERGALVHRVTRASCNLRDAEQTQALFERTRPDIVFHLASASGGSTSCSNILPHLQDDIVTTANCLVAAQNLGVKRFVIPGSTDEPESGPPDSPYSMAKHTCVTYAQMFNRLYNVPTVICRLFMVFGPEQKPRKILPYIIRSMIAGEAPRLASSARRVDWIYVDDAVEALLRIGVAPNVEGCTVEIGRGETLSIEEMATRVQRLIPGAPAPVCAETSAYGKHRRADLTEAERLLAWKPEVSLDEGLMQTIEWYRSAGPHSPQQPAQHSDARVTG